MEHDEEMLGHLGEEGRRQWMNGLLESIENEKGDFLLNFLPLPLPLQKTHIF